MDTIMILIQQIIIMFLLMLVGYLLMKIRMIDHHGVRQLGDLVLYVANPAVIISSFMTPFSQTRLLNGWYTFLLTMMVIIVSIIIGRILYKKNSLNEFGVIFCNVGFLGIPLVKNVLGEECVFYITVYVAVVTVVVWSYGIYLITKDKSMMNIQKIVFNPCILALLIGIICFCMSIRLPAVLDATIVNIGNLNTPLAMMVLGCYLAQGDLKKVLSDIDTYKVCFGRLIIIPLVTLGILFFIPNTIMDVKMTVLIASSTPVAALLAIFCNKYGKDYAYGAGVVGVSTVFSLLTMPLFVYLLSIL